MFTLSKHLEHGERVKIIARRIAVIFLVLLVIVGALTMECSRHEETQPICGTGASTPEAATEELMLAVSKSDWVTACKYTTSNQDTVRNVFSDVAKMNYHKARKLGTKNGRVQVKLTGSTGNNSDDDISWSFWTIERSDRNGWLVIIDPS